MAIVFLVAAMVYSLLFMLASSYLAVKSIRMGEKWTAFSCFLVHVLGWIALLACSELLTVLLRK